MKEKKKFYRGDAEDAEKTEERERERTTNFTNGLE
jgi:hypothetical protein